MDPHPILVQSVFTVPMIAALVVYALLRRDRTRLHTLLAGLLASVAVWMVSLTVGVVASSPTLRSVALDVQFLTIAIMAPFFLVTMGHMARSPLFERSPAATIALFSIFALFFVAYLTNDAHQLFLTDREAAMAALPLARWAGPLFWGQQIWCLTCNALAFAFIVLAIRRGRTEGERRRGLVVLAAAVMPVLTHVVYLLDWLPLDYSLSPATLGITALFFVQGVNRYGLLDSQPIVRHDVLEHIPDGLLLTDPDGVVIDSNAAAQSALGGGREQFQGRPLAAVLERLGFDGAVGVGERIARLPLKGGRLTEEVVAGDGRAIEIVAGAVAAANALPAGRFVTLRDRTAQRRSERLLLERQRLESVGILAAGVAHEVNNPLAYVRANLTHLQAMVEHLRKHLGPGPPCECSELDEMPDVVSESLDGLERIRSIVKSMLRLSRPPDEETGAVDVNDVVEQALRLAELQRAPKVRVIRTLTANLPQVAGAADRLIQVVLNLLLNARQALGEAGGGCIVAETALEAGHVVVRVRDDGPGIPPEHRNRLFDPFFTTRAPGEGTGLGLSIAFDIVREHGGVLELEPLDEGTCFAMRLPL